MDAAPSSDRVEARTRVAFWWVMGGIVAVGLAARLVFALALAPDLPLPGDAGVYREMAQHLVDGDGLSLGRPGDGVMEPTAEHPPLFPGVLAALDVLGLGSVQEQRVGLAILSTAAVPLVGLVGRRVGGATVGLLAGGVAAVHPFWIQPSGMVMSESLHLVVVSGVLLLCLRLLDSGSVMAVAGLGAAIGVAGLGRPESLGLLVVAALPAVWSARWIERGRLRQAGWLALGAVVVVAPWVARNERVLGAPVLATNSGKTVLGSSCDDTYAGRALGGFSYDCFFGSATVLVQFGPEGGGSWTGRTLDDEMGRIGRAYVRDHLDELPKVVAARVVRMWGLAFAGDQLDFDVYEGRHRRLQRAGQWVHLALLPAAVGGAWILLRGRRRPAAIVLLGPVVLVTAATVLVYGGSRMRSSAEASIAVLAAVGTAAAARWIATRGGRGAPGGGGSLSAT
ncbi:MAG: glycosyltransferase family 39 protein [Acidimicrobiales bacterium]